MTQYGDIGNINKELDSAFDESGYSEFAKKFKYTIEPVCQILDCKENRKELGGVAEGTLIDGSDMDSHYIDRTGITVGYAQQEAVPHTGKPYLCLTRGSSTPAGYTKLQIYLNGRHCCKKG